MERSALLVCSGLALAMLRNTLGASNMLEQTELTRLSHEASVHALVDSIGSASGAPLSMPCLLTTTAGDATVDPRR